jgi:predicted aspartyl protease
VILGRVYPEGEPTITVPIAGQDWKTIIDTGFNGDLELPLSLQGSLNARYVGYVTSALAGGQVIEEILYLVDFPFDGRIVSAQATFIADADILLGAHLLRDYSLLINFTSKLVQLERVT